MARVEMKRRYTWTIFQNIEYSAEHDQVKVGCRRDISFYQFPVSCCSNLFLSCIISSMTCLCICPKLPNKSKTRINCQHHRLVNKTFIMIGFLDSFEMENCLFATDSSDDDFADESSDSLDEGIEEPRPYKGPHLTLPLEKQDLDMLINLFRKRKYKFHAKYVAMILREAAKKLRRLDNINKASTEVKGSKTVTVVGDLHGKLDDLLVILYKVSLNEHSTND